MKTALDTYEMPIMPKAKRDYLIEYGFEFSKKACEYAVKQMRRKGNERVDWTSKDDIDAILKKNGVEVDNKNGYNYVYAWHYFIADYSELIKDEATRCKFVKAAIDDEDFKGGNFFRHWLADCAAKGVVIDWADLM